MNLKFETLTCQKLLELKPYFQMRPTFCCESHLTYHLIWSHYYETKYCADERGLLWIQKIDYDEKAAMVPVCRAEDMKVNFQRLQDYFTEVLRVKMHMYLVDQEALDAIAPDQERYEIIADSDSYDYIYNGDSLRRLGGRSYAKHKNMVSRFLRDYGERAQFVLLSGGDEAEILSFASRWFENKEQEDELKRLDSEKKGIRSAIRWNNREEMAIAGVRVDGRLEALTIGSYDPQTDMAVIHVEKANPKLRGLYQFIGMKFLQEVYPEVRYINREDDMGFENLRRTKESLHPLMRGVKYTILEKQLPFPSVFCYTK